MIRLSILDQAPIAQGHAPADAIAETLRLAQQADRWGYHRYWMAEHHNSDSLGCATPEVLLPVLASRTGGLRVGSGGVLLSLHSPLRVAEAFRMLESVFPGRIDLGLGRAAGGSPLTTAALVATTNAASFGPYLERVQDLLGFLDRDLPPEHAFHKVHASPAGPGRPQVWLLGSGTESAEYAARLGCAYCYAQFIHPRGGAEALALYRDRFAPSARLDTPQGAVCVMAQCADTEAEARRLSQSRYLWVVRTRKGEGGPMPSVEEAQSYPYTDADRYLLSRLDHHAIAGDPEQLRGRLSSLARDYGVEELFVLTLCHAYDARLRSYELLAQAFGLEPRNQGRASTAGGGLA